MADHDVMSVRPGDPPRRRGPAALVIILTVTLLLAWAGLVVGAVLALTPTQATADLAVGLAWTVVISAISGVAISALYTLVFAPQARD